MSVEMRKATGVRNASRPLLRSVVCIVFPPDKSPSAGVHAAMPSGYLLMCSDFSAFSGQ